MINPPQGIRFWIVALVRDFSLCGVAMRATSCPAVIATEADKPCPVPGPHFEFNFTTSSGCDDDDDDER